MKQKLYQLLLGLGMAVALSACEYSNSFNGTYNNAPATLNAYASDINRYCVALTLNSAQGTIRSSISAQSTYDPNNLQATTQFNTKGAQCAAPFSQYLVGSRSIAIVSQQSVQDQQNLGNGLCRSVSYVNYQYQENVAFDVRDNATDQVIGSFSGTSGTVNTFADTDHISYGPAYQCGGAPLPPYPYPYPYPNPYPPYPYPGPYPHPFPHPEPPHPQPPHPQPQPPHPQPQPPHPQPQPPHPQPQPPHPQPQPPHPQPQPPHPQPQPPHPQPQPPHPQPQPPHPQPQPPHPQPQPPHPQPQPPHPQPQPPHPQPQPPHPQPQPPHPQPQPPHPAPQPPHPAPGGPHHDEVNAE